MLDQVWVDFKRHLVFNSLNMRGLLMNVSVSLEGQIWRMENPRTFELMTKSSIGSTAEQRRALRWQDGIQGDTLTLIWALRKGLRLCETICKSKRRFLKNLVSQFVLLGFQKIDSQHVFQTSGPGVVTAASLAIENATVRLLQNLRKL